MAWMVGCVHASIVVVKDHHHMLKLRSVVQFRLQVQPDAGPAVRTDQDIWGPSFKSSWHPKIAALRPLAEWFSSPHQFPTPVSLIRRSEGAESLRDKTGIGMHVARELKASYDRLLVRHDARYRKLNAR
jgi:hypothetical protein